MAKRSPINNEKRSYLVLKTILKFCRINQKSIALKKAAQPGRFNQFNWLKSKEVVTTAIKAIIVTAVKTLAVVASRAMTATAIKSAAAVGIKTLTVAANQAATAGLRSAENITQTYHRIIKSSVVNTRRVVADVRQAIWQTTRTSSQIITQATLRRTWQTKNVVKKSGASMIRTQPYVLYRAANGWSVGPLLRWGWRRATSGLPIKVELPQSALLRSALQIGKVTIKAWSTLVTIKSHLWTTSTGWITQTIKVARQSIALPAVKPTIHLHVFRQWRWMVVSISLLLVVAIGYGLYSFILRDLPSPQQLTQRDQIVTTRIMDRNGEVLFRIYEDENRTIVHLSDIPQDLVHATIAIEDKNFYHHHGFSVRGIVRAAVANTRGQTIQQGGSTITQQLVKKRLLSSERTIQRKLRELVLSVLVEFNYSKNQILEMYFNQVPYGGSTYGVEEAAQRYFGKSVRDLNLAEASLLAGLPAAPSVYTPFGPNPETAKYRQQEVLRRMAEDGYITPEQAETAYRQPLEFRHDTIDIKAPHFVMYVRKLLAEQYGEAMVNQGGLAVTTTIDLDLQEAAQQKVTEEVKKLTPLRVTNGAALVTNPKTGEILAMVGSKDYFDFGNDGTVNVTDRPRQPGSSIKPLTYAIALERGKTPHTLIDDSPVTYHTLGSVPYSPKNYDGKYHGKVTLRESLASSYNIPAVKTLAEVGIDTMIDKAQQMGIDTWQDRRRFGLSLTLGGGEVRMTDMAEVYSTFANYGYTVDLNSILEVKNYKGEVLYRNTCVLDHKGCPQRRTLNPLVAYQISDILKDNQARSPAFGTRSVLHIPNQEVAVKTGTTNSLRDNWTIGYTTNRLVAVWVGNNDNKPMSYVASGVTGASPIWNNIMRLLLDDKQPHRFPTPEGMIKVKICSKTGTLPCQGCPSVREELFIPGTEPTKQCSPNWFQKKPDQPAASPNASRDQILTGAASLGQ